MGDPLVSIIMRSFNEGWALCETLPALQAQRYHNWELIVIDSGSTDGSVELLRRAQPRHFIQIQPHEYNPSRVLNCGMELARSQFGIFLNADATPQGPDWLRPLVQALFEPRTAAVFGRQVPRPDCQAVYACDYERCFGPNRESAHWEHFFSMASSGLRKDIWARRGFDEKFQYSEDDEYTRWCKAQGYRIVYVSESVVAHSHNYTPEQAYQRSFGEGRAVAAITAIELRRKPQDRRQRQLPLPVRNERGEGWGEGWGEGHPTPDAQASHKQNDPPLPGPLLPRREERGNASLPSPVSFLDSMALFWRGRHEMFGICWVLMGWLNDLRRDLVFCARARRWREWPHAARIRWQQRQGKRAGFHEGWLACKPRSIQGWIKLLDFSLSSIRWRRGLGRGGALSLLAPLLGPLPTRSSQGEDGEPDTALRSVATLDAGLSTLDSDQRFTIDGSDELEGHLRQICDQVRDGVRAVVPAQRLEALLLGGGYGRGEGGVWRAESGDWPYNDLEFYVFLRGSLWLNERRYQTSLQALAKRLSAASGVPAGPPAQDAEIAGKPEVARWKPAPRLDMEFKISSLAKLRRSPVTMFSYDLITGHRRLLSARRASILSVVTAPGAGSPAARPNSFRGEERLLAAFEHHRDATRIPLAEATRLLMNRCSGLLFALERLRQTPFTPEDADFVGRNLAKAQLAFGDAVLTAYGQYHWSCRERQRRLQQLRVGEDLPWLAEVGDHHAAGVAFKLHPQRTTASCASLQDRHAELTALALHLWLWLEGRRLNHPFLSAYEYALSPLNKCPETKGWRNLLINLRTFGPASLLSIGFLKAVRYPRERIFHALALLLWEPGSLSAGASLHRLQNELRTTATGFSDLITAYQRLWGWFR